MIKQPLFAIASAVLLVIVLWFVADRVHFLRTAEKTKGSVTSVSAANGRCGGGRRRRSYSCTRYHATVSYVARATGTTYNLNLSAGSTRGYDQPVGYADYKEGDTVPIVYDPKNPAKAYEDSIGGVWGAPLMALMFQIGSFIASLTEPRRKTYS